MKRGGLLIALMVASTRIAGAQEVRPLSLAEAQREAREHAPEGAELAARVRGAELEASAAGRVFRNNPVLSGAYSTGAVFGEQDEQSWSVGISQTFDMSGSWSPRGASARAARDQAAYDRQEGLLALDEAVAVAVADVAMQQERVERTTRIVQLQTTALDAAHKQLDVGQGNQLDADAADLDLAGARADAALAEGALGAARAVLARLLGRSGGTVALVVEDRLESGNIEETVASRVDASPRVQAARADLRAAELGLSTQERMIWPEVTLRLSYDSVRQDAPIGAFRGPGAGGLSAAWDEHEIGVGLEVPLPFFDQRQTERAQADTRVLAAEARERVVEADVRRDLEAAHAQLEASARALQALSNTPQILARELELLDKAVRSGALDAVARAVAIRRLQEAGARYDEAVRQLRVARARWRHVTAMDR